MRNDAPVGHTCPLIDYVIQNINSISFDESENECKIIINEVSKTMEDIRNANQALRNWGYDNSKRIEELEEQNYDFEKKISELENMLHDANKDISILEREKEELVEEIESLKNESIRESL